MRLPSFLQRKDKTEREAAVPVSDQGNAVLAARTLARRRLIGAVVLLGIGIVGFPLLFETQPRPVAGDIPIEIVGKATAPVTSMPVRPPPEPVSEPVAPPPAAVITERPGDAGTEVPPPKPAAKLNPLTAAPAATVASVASMAPTPKTAASAAKTERAVAASIPAPTPAPVPAPRAATSPTSASATPHDDGARAQALLNGGAPASAAPAASAPGRFVVQVGAYTDANALRDARQRVEKLGLKTYTQQVESEAGKRTRVRVGPFATRKEAEAAAAKLKAAGLPTGLLAL